MADTERRYGTACRVFHFNHLDPALKDPDYEHPIRNNLSSGQLDELDKCNLLYSDCHGPWYGQNLYGRLKARVTLTSGPVVEESASFHGLFDLAKPKSFPFSDFPLKLEPYAYRLGSVDRVTVVGRDLEERLVSLMLPTKQGHLLQVFDGKGPVLTIERLDDARMKFWFPVRFPLVKAEFRTEDPQFPHVWIRNGRMIAKGCGAYTTGQLRGELFYDASEAHWRATG